jgi:N-acetylglucosamine malate deacetylase 1
VFALGNYIRADGVKVEETTRKLETANAMRRLGVDSFAFVRAFYENQGDMVGQESLIRRVEEVIGGEKPDEVFVNLPSSNQDHNALHDATITALRPDRFGVKRIWAYEHTGNSWGPPPPSWGRCYVRLTEADIAAKLNALWEHKSQFEGRGPQHSSPKGAQKLAALRGSECGAEFGELLYLLREVY